MPAVAKRDEEHRSAGFLDDDLVREQIPVVLKPADEHIEPALRDFRERQEPIHGNRRLEARHEQADVDPRARHLVYVAEADDGALDRSRGVVPIRPKPGRRGVRLDPVR